MNEKYNVYIYGCGYMYNKLANLFHQCTDCLNILGIVTSTQGLYKKIDGYDCLTVDEIKDWGEVDFIIIAVEKWTEIFDILMKKGIEENKIIRGDVFELPDFSFIDYIKLKSSNISILANYCLGGMVYKKLGLKILSPTINMYCAGKGYLKFLENYEYYLNCEMQKMEWENYVDGMLSPEAFYQKGVLDNEIVWNFNHSSNADEAIAEWNKRKKRFNDSNVAVIMIIQSDEDAFRFEQLKIEKKIGFYYRDLHLKYVVYLPEWKENPAFVLKYGGSWPRFVNEYMAGENGYVSPINWIRFLSGAGAYCRKILR